MNSTRFRSIVLLTVISIGLYAVAQHGVYSTRSLLEKKVYYVAGGKIGTCSFWSLHLGKFDCTLNRYFAGEGNIDIEGALNFALLSSAYIEGRGYGVRGKMGAEAQFAIEDGDSIRVLELGDIDYVYQNGKRVKVKNGNDCPLILSCEVNRHTIKRMKIMIWSYDKKYKELKHFRDIDMVTAFSFTKEGAYRALRASK